MKCLYGYEALWEDRKRSVTRKFSEREKSRLLTRHKSGDRRATELLQLNLAHICYSVSERLVNWHRRKFKSRLLVDEVIGEATLHLASAIERLRVEEKYDLQSYIECYLVMEMKKSFAYESGDILPPSNTNSDRKRKKLEPYPKLKSKGDIVGELEFDDQGGRWWYGKIAFDVTSCTPAGKSYTHRVTDTRADWNDAFDRILALCQSDLERSIVVMKIKGGTNKLLAESLGVTAYVVRKTIRNLEDRAIRERMLPAIESKASSSLKGQVPSSSGRSSYWGENSPINRPKRADGSIMRRVDEKAKATVPAPKLGTHRRAMVGPSY